MTDSFAGLPPILREIAGVAGLDKALALAESYGGSRVNVPAYPKPDSWIVACVGIRAATAICDHYRVFDADNKPIATQLALPRGPMALVKQAKARLARDLQEGKLSVRDAARRQGLAERTAWRMKRKMGRPPDGNQGELFEPPLADKG